MSEVVILCGGRGTRMNEETDIRPKPMVEIGGKPILWHIMKYYSCFGFNKFILALGYKAEHIKSFFYNYRIEASDFTITLDPNKQPKIHSQLHGDHWEITCVDTGIPNLKGSRIKQLEPYIQGEYFHLTYGDGVGTVDLKSLEAFHRKHNNIGTVTAVRPPSRFGEMTIEGERISRFVEKAQMATGFINGGFFIFKREFLNYLTADEGCDFEFGALQKLASEGRLMAYKHEKFWQCMDTVREKDYLNELWAEGKAPWKIW